MHKHYFLNLTNGIEFLKTNPQSYSFLRLRSTDIERKNWYNLFYQLDFNFLMHVAAGSDCVFVDYGTLRKNSKTVYYGIPLVKYVLNRFWYDVETTPFRYTRSDFRELPANEFSDIYEDLFVNNQNSIKGLLKLKLNYFKPYLSGTINLTSLGIETKMDGRKDFYKSCLVK